MSDLSGRRILVLDDDEAQREVVAEILELEGARVLNARSFDEAARLLGEAPDVVLMDLHGVDSDKFMRLLRTLPRAPRVLLVSGDMKVRGHAERLHVDGWLAKPYDVDQLLDACRNVLGQEKGEPTHPSA